MKKFMCYFLVLLGMIFTFSANAAQVKIIDGVTYLLYDGVVSVIDFDENMNEFVVKELVEFNPTSDDRGSTFDDPNPSVGLVRYFVTEMDLSPAYPETRVINSLTLPSSIKKMKRNCFKNWEVKNLYIESLKTWCHIIFECDFHFGNTFSYFSSSANPIGPSTKVYINNELVEDLLIGSYSDFSQLEYISAFAFANLNCKSIEIGRGIRSIGVNAFENTTAEVLTMSNAVDTIFNNAFQNSTKLQKIKLSSNLKYVGNEAFYRCSPSEIYCPSLESFMGIHYNLQESAYPGSQISHSYDLFINDEKITDIVIPGETKEVSQFCFAGANIRSVVYEEGITYSGSLPFNDCKYLERVFFPSTMTYMGCDFKNCPNLKEVYCMNPEPPVSPEYSSIFYAFDYGPFALGFMKETLNPDCILYVPDESVELYSSAEGWKEFSQILPLSTSSVKGFEANSAYQKEQVIYDLMGRRVNSENLPKGIYIQNGKKILVK